MSAAENVAGFVTDAEIEAERARLAAARSALRGMRDEVLHTETPLNDADETDEIWHNTVYQQARARRARELVDLPEVPLFFGRLDYEPGAVFDDAGTGETDRVYVGRRHVRDGEGRPMVVDWWAPVSAPFYRATREDPRGVRLRRRYGCSEAAELTAYEDEPLTGPAAGASADRSALVAEEIERPWSGPMRDIVATIQPEQDELVRAPLLPTLCARGARHRQDRGGLAPAGVPALHRGGTADPRRWGGGGGTQPVVPPLHPPRAAGVGGGETR